jgi:NAD(P)-dependent dehydrogenase (short-subunit alcohol dehydrogenase family)
MKNYLIIGGTSGIGLGIVKRLGQTECKRYVVAREKDDLDDSSVEFIAADVTEESLSFDNLPDTLNGLVYCPGTIRLKPFRQLKESDFIEDFHINLLGAVKSIQACLGQLKASKNAAIVLFSTVAVQTGMSFHASVASAKGAIEGLTRSLAAEFAPAIRVNAIAPSMTDTRLAQRFLSSPERQQAAAVRHPLKTYGQPSDIAAMATFLLQDTSRWITGQIFQIDGGMSSVRLF